MEKCIFCMMAEGRMQCSRVYEDEKFLAFRDINPQAPVHILIFPKKHIEKLHDAADVSLLVELLNLASMIARDEGIADSGYRVVVNNGRDAGQSVEHLHVHLLGGRIMKWPPG